MASLQWTNVAFLPLMAGALQAALTFMVWRHRHRPIGVAFLAFLITTMIWSFGYAVELCATDLRTALFWVNIEYVGIPAVPGSVLAFVLLLSGARPNRRWWLLGVPTLLVWPAVWSDATLHLLHLNLRFHREGTYYALLFNPGPAYLFNVAASYIFLLLAIGALFRLLRGRNELSRNQAAVVLAGIGLPVGINVLHLLGHEPIQGLDLTPAMFALSALLAAFGIFRYSLVSVVPIAREQVVDDLADGVLVLDAQGRVVDANPAAGKILHHPIKELLQLGKEQLSLALMQPAIDVGCNHKVELGDRAYFLRCTPVRGDGQEPLGTVIQLTDITDQHRAEEALRNAKEAAEEASATKSRFVANISHELRTPLNGVIGLSELLEKTALNEGQLRYLRGIRHCSETLLSLINDVLDLSKIEAGALTLVEETFDPAALIEEITEVHRSLAERKGVAVLSQVRELPALLLGDSLRLKQILNNLIGNAVKFTHKGSVTLTAEPISGTFYEISIRDTGIGIPLEKQASVFEAFQQADASTTRQYGGTGLGLPITARLVSGMGGSISLISAAGKGTEMRVILPMKVATAEPRGAVTGASENVKPGLRVLVAEDNEVNALVILSLLEDLGCDADHVTDGEQALDKAESGAYDILLLDIQMPKMDGLEVARALREREPDRPFRIYALTANALEDERQRALAAGMDGFLTKPIRREEIVNALREATAGRY